MQCKDDKVKDLRLRLLRMVDEQDDHPHQTFASLRWHAALGQGWRRPPFPSCPIDLMNNDGTDPLFGLLPTSCD